MKERKLKTCEALRLVQIRLMQPGAPAPDVTRLLDMRRIQEAKASFPYDVDEPGTYVAHWGAFGFITYEQITVMEWIIMVKNTLREVGFTLDWIERVLWKETDLCVVKETFGDEHALSKVDRKAAVMGMPMDTMRLVFREAIWLNCTCIITGMMYLQHAYAGVAS
ncbi:hypothetical protein PC128_g3091 [Phytophthora cactorum]|nr:hypothetical protein PC128_g3091 [Phytophthora cactorum]